MLNLIKQLVTSKKAIAMIAGVIVALAARYGLELDPVSVGTILSPIVAYIIGQGMADKGQAAAQITALAEISPSEAKKAIQK